MNRLDEILTYRALAFKHGHSVTTNSGIDAVIGEGSTQTKNVCAHLSLPLVDRLENALGILDMSKRAFIESAIIDALDRYDSIASEHDIFEPYYVTDEEAKAIKASTISVSDEELAKLQEMTEQERGAFFASRLAEKGGE
jgi:hypothetical protein